MKELKVAISQRIIPHYRVPVFTELANREGIDLTVFYGKGFPSGSQANATRIEGFKHVKLFTIFLTFLSKGNRQLWVFHPALFFHLLFGWYDVVIAEPSTNIFNDIFIFLYCKVFRKKFIWYEAGAVPKKERTKNRKLIDPLVTLFTKRSDAYITYNSFAEAYLKSCFNLPDSKIFRAQNALDTRDIIEDIEKFQSSVESKKVELGVDGCKIALFIGGVEKRKRINNLITAISNLNSEGIKAKTIIVGDGPDLEWIKENTSTKEKNSTLFLGKHIDDSVLYILMSDVVVLPAQGGLSINHAFACGKPFIGTIECVSPNTNSIYDYVSDGENGYVVEVNSIPALQEKLKLIFTDKTLYSKLCNGAIKTSKIIDVPHMVDGIEHAVRYVLNRNYN